MKAMDFLNWQSDGGPKAEFVDQITCILEEVIEVDRSDAQGIVDANADSVVQGWNLGLSPEAVAAQIAVWE